MGTCITCEPENSGEIDTQQVTGRSNNDNKFDKETVESTQRSEAVSRLKAEIANKSSH